MTAVSASLGALPVWVMAVYLAGKSGLCRALLAALGSLVDPGHEEIGVLSTPDASLVPKTTGEYAWACPSSSLLSVGQNRAGRTIRIILNVF